MHQRICGECTACCTTHAIFEINKPQGKICPHCTSKGCECYDSKPEVCTLFKCQWLKGYGDENDRPDLLEIIYDRPPEAIIPLMQMWEVRPGSLTTLRAWTDIRKFLDREYYVGCLYLSGKMELYVPDNHILPDKVVKLTTEQGVEVKYFPIIGI